MFETTYGRFIENGRGFVITDPRTPMPWTNVVSNGRYGFVTSQNGGGFSFVDHCQLNVLTRWDMDLAVDQRGKFLYLSDLDSGEVWSLAPAPCRPECDEFRCVHRPGTTTFETVTQGIRAIWTMAAPEGTTAEVWRVQLRNEGTDARRLRLASFLEWCCGTAPDIKREFHRLFFDVARRDGAILARKHMWEAPFGTPDDHWNRPWPHVAVHAVGGFEGDDLLLVADKRRFLGRDGDPATPVAMTESQAPRGGFGRFGDASACAGGDFVLEPGEERVVPFVLAQASDEEEAMATVARFTSVTAVELAIEQVESAWEARLGPTSVRTERPDFDLLNNTWLPYQAISARLWARTGYYQQSGAFGFRDQLQDSHVWLTREPERCAAQIMQHAAHQFANGSVYHWWNPITETGLRTTCSDDLLWLPFLTVSYLKETGDPSILERTARFVDDEHEASLLEHCRRAFAHSSGRLGAHGLPLIGDMDWNDGLSALGETGESVWLAIFLVGLCRDFAEVERRWGDEARARDLLAQGERLEHAVQSHAWDGAWFRRATRASGEWLGSKEASAGRIFLNPQSWAILHDLSDEAKLDRAWASVREHLLTEYGPLLLAPAFTDPDPDVGYITRYAPGARENGGVYMHAATWALAAACRRRDLDAVESIWNSISPPVRSERDPDAYHAEPYVVPGNVDGPLSDLPGRAGWTWYTGSAAWLHKVSLDWILGIRAEFDGIRIEPCPPRSLGRVEVERPWRGRVLRLSFDATTHDPETTPTLVVDGRVQTTTLLTEETLEASEGEIITIDVQWRTAATSRAVPARSMP